MALMTPEALRDLLTIDDARLQVRGECQEVRPQGFPIIQAVWANGSLLRVEEPPGRVDTVVGSTNAWHHDPHSGRILQTARTPDVSNPYTSPRILERRSAEFWEAMIDAHHDDIMATVRRVKLHDRPAVRLDLPGKTAAVRVTVDEQTGVWLEALLDGEMWLSWIWVKFDDQFDPHLFHVEA